MTRLLSKYLPSCFLGSTGSKVVQFHESFIIIMMNEFCFSITAFSGRKINEFNQTWIDVEIEANANHFKPDVAEDIKELVRRNFTYEIKFYEFCKERLQKQLSELKKQP